METISKLDYLTMTSYEPQAWEMFKQLLDASKSKEESTMMQYAGWKQDTGNGTLFVGSGKQGLRNHLIMSCSGIHSQEIMRSTAVQQGLQMGFMRSSRIDIQVTLAWEGDAHTDLWKAFNRLQRDGGVTVGWVESNSKEWGKLATLYIGSRSSGNFMRLYMKPESGEMRIRCELEMKREVAHSAGKMLLNGQQDNIIMARIQRIGDSIMVPFENALSGINPERVRVAKRDTKTEEWLLSTVLPAFIRHIESHDDNGDVAAQFTAALERHYRYQL